MNLLFLAWTIYEKPSDFPNGYVARAFVNYGGEPAPTYDAFYADTLEGIRSFINEFYPDLICFPRSDGDEPQIVETWL